MKGVGRGVAIRADFKTYAYVNHCIHARTSQYRLNKYFAGVFVRRRSTRFHKVQVRYHRDGLKFEQTQTPCPIPSGCEIIVFCPVGVISA